MNARWLKQNLGPVLFGVGFFVVLGLLAWRLGMAKQDLAEVETNLQAQQDRLHALESKNPSPSKDNVQALSDDGQRLKNILHEFSQKIRGRASFSVPADAQIHSVIEFSEQMPRRLKVLDIMTRQAGVRIPDGFKFSFDRYATTLPCRNPPAAGEECDKILDVLSKQLRAIERLTSLMVSNGVDQIDLIRRTDVEQGSGGVADSTLPIAYDDRAECLIIPFELKFACNAQALQGFLNALNRDSWIFTIRSLNVNAQGGTAEGSSAGGSSHLSVTTKIDLLEFQQTKPQNQPPAKSSLPNS